MLPVTAAAANNFDNILQNYYGITITTKIKPKQLSYVRKLVLTVDIVNQVDDNIEVKLLLFKDSTLDKVLNNIQPPSLPPFLVGDSNY